MSRHRHSFSEGLRRWLAEGRAVEPAGLLPTRREVAQALLKKRGAQATLDSGEADADLVAALVANIRRRARGQPRSAPEHAEVLYDFLSRVPDSKCPAHERDDYRESLAICAWWTTLRLGLPDAEARWFARLPPFRPSPFVALSAFGTTPIGPNASELEPIGYTDEWCFGQVRSLFARLDQDPAEVVRTARAAYTMIGKREPVPDLDAGLACARLATVIALGYAAIGKVRSSERWVVRARSGFLDEASSSADLAFLELDQRMPRGAKAGVADAFRSGVLRRFSSAEGESENNLDRTERRPSNSTSTLMPKPLNPGQPESLMNWVRMMRALALREPNRVREVALSAYRALPHPHSATIRRYGGELALLIGSTFRMTFHRRDARAWLDLAEEYFQGVADTRNCLARLRYQRLALALEERQFELVNAELPSLIEELHSLGLETEELRARFIQGSVLREIGDLAGAIEVFLLAANTAKKLEDHGLIGMALGNLAQIYRQAEKLDEALSFATGALPFLQEIDDGVNLAKLRWCMGDIFRAQSKAEEALEAYRSALLETERIGTRNDTVALHLVIAELLLDLLEDRKAEWEVRAALPIIDEERMVPEGLAALGLLRASVRRRQIDRAALREVHGFLADR